MDCYRGLAVTSAILIGIVLVNHPLFFHTSFFNNFIIDILLLLLLLFNSHVRYIMFMP
jgi:hypothetical protein